MTAPRTRARLAAVAVTVTLGLLTGCGGSGPSGTDTSTTPARPERPAVTNADLKTYDAFVLASAENNPLFADVFAIRFNPFRIDRLTTNKRVSSLSADTERIVVAAADSDVDRLAQLTGNGDLQPIPGLGRPFAYTPILRDGVMYFHDAQGNDARGEFRYYAWDLQTQKKTLLFQSVPDLGTAQPLSGGRFLVFAEEQNGTDVLAIRSQSGKLTKYPLNGEASDVEPGRRHLAATLVGAGDQFGDKPEALALVDLKTGKTRRIPGLQLVCWSPDGTRLLARRTDAQTDSHLVLLDPAKPNTLLEIATVPGLAIYSGTWVRGDVGS